MKTTHVLVGALISLLISTHAFAAEDSFSVDQGNTSFRSSEGAAQTQDNVPQVRTYDGPTIPPPNPERERREAAQRDSARAAEEAHRDRYRHHETGETWHPSRTWDDDE